MERQDQWDNLEAQAEYMLEHPRLLPPQNGNPKGSLVLRLWHYPAFGPYTVWFAHRSRRKQKPLYLLRKAVWDRSNDAERFLNPLEGLKRGVHANPTITIHDIEVSSEKLEPELRVLEEIEILPFSQSGTIGLDGEVFGVQYGGEIFHSRISWWCDGPKEWQEVVAWFIRVTSFFDSEFQEPHNQHI